MLPGRAALSIVDCVTSMPQAENVLTNRPFPGAKYRSFFFEVIGVKWRFCANGCLYVALRGFLSEIADLVAF